MEATTVITTEKLSASRWIVLAIIVLAQFQIMLVAFAPAAVASPIISDLRLTRTEFGLIISALNIAVMICQVLGSVLVDRAGLKLGLLSGVALLGIGAAIMLFVHSLALVLFSRVLQGIGIGICYPVMGALIVAWFSKREQPYINTIFCCGDFLGNRIRNACHCRSISLVQWLVEASTRHLWDQHPRHGAYLAGHRTKSPRDFLHGRDTSGRRYCQDHEFSPDSAQYAGRSHPRARRLCDLMGLQHGLFVHTPVSRNQAGDLVVRGQPPGFTSFV
jgi:hypothetical protein